MGSAATARTAVRVVLLSVLALVSASALASVSHAEPEGATPGSGRGAAAVIAAGGFHSCAVLENGTVRCWGGNDVGQLGYGDTDDRGDNAGEMGDNLDPIALGTGRTAIAIAAGGFHSCALLDNGAVKCWGNNDVGQLGHGDTDDRGDDAGEMGDNLAPIALGTGRTATAIAAGDSHTCALLDNGTVKCWGATTSASSARATPTIRGDGAGEMGDNLARGRPRHRSHRHRDHAGGVHTCALLDDGTVKCWGANDAGQLGYGDTELAATTPARWATTSPPIDLGTGRTAVAITAGDAHTCALLDNGTVKCWGYNVNGQLGQGDTDDRGDDAGEMGDNLPPVDLGTGRTATAITAGDFHTCAVLDNDTVKCWGSNVFGAARPGRHGATVATTPARWAISWGRSVSAPAAPQSRSPPATSIRVRCSTTTPSSAGGRTSSGSSARATWTTAATTAGEMGDSLASVVVEQFVEGGSGRCCARPPVQLVRCRWFSKRVCWRGRHRLMTVGSRSSDTGSSRRRMACRGRRWSLDTGSTTTSFTATGLTAGVAVRFRVAAINSIGVSPPTLPTSAVVPTATGRVRHPPKAIWCR